MLPFLILSCASKNISLEQCIADTRNNISSLVIFRANAYTPCTSLPLYIYLFVYPQVGEKKKIDIAMCTSADRERMTRMTCLSYMRKGIERKKMRVCLLLFPSLTIYVHIFVALSKFVLFSCLITKLFIRCIIVQRRKENKQVLIIVVIRNTHLTHTLKNKRRNARNFVRFSLMKQHVKGM